MELVDDLLLDERDHLDAQHTIRFRSPVPVPMMDVGKMNVSVHDGFVPV
jgi:hypothetical protein